MGKRGPKPKPLEEKLLEGNPGKGALVERVEEDDLSFGTLRMPQRLTEMERQVWNDTLMSFPSWYFRPADKMLLIAYCRAVVRLEKSEKALQNKSAVEKRSNGSPCISPHITVINSSLSQVMHLSEMLGITRKSRKDSMPLGVIASTEKETTEIESYQPVGDDQDVPEDLIAGPI